MKALIVEDEQILSDTIAESIGHLFDCTQAFDGEEGLFEAEQAIYDVIILDIMMPYMNGYEVLEALRAKHIATPVLMLTAKDGIDDKVRGFKAGADDYLVKPFHREELLARLEAVVRRAGGGLKDNLLQFKGLVMNVQNHEVKIDEQPVTLQGKQFDILEYLLNNPNTILTKEQIFDRIWGFDSETTTNVVEVYASGLRKVLKQYGYDSYVKTIRGLGYMFAPEEGGE